MARAARTFRIFISSTFTDLKEERNALQERVFPRLRDFCLQHGARFQAIDLRWGVSAEAGLDQQTITICLDEVKRCQDTSPRPNFIVLLGDRYGWQPPPPQIPKHDFDEILRRVSDQEAKALLEEWYVLDENAVPPERYLKPREDRYRDDDTWGPVEAALRRALEDAVADMSLELADRRRYETSATEQEIQRGALRSLEDHVFCYFRTIDFGAGEDLPDHELLKDFVDLEPSGARDQTARNRLERLKGELRGLPDENVHDYDARWTGESPVPVTMDHLDRLCVDVYEDLLRIITEEIDRIAQVEPPRREIEAHEEFEADRGDVRLFTGRTQILEDIRSYVESQAGNALVVFGSSGSGKSSVMARASQMARERFPDSVLIRFIGVTPESSNGRSLLDSLCREITRRYGGDETTIPADYRELVRDFQERLGLASSERPLILFLDALDQLSQAEGARSLSWLPSDLPDGVRVIVSALPEDTLTALRARLPETSFVELAPMEAGEGAALLDLWLQDAARTLQPRQRQEVLDRFEVERLPLWLKLAFEEARRWKSDEEKLELPPTIPAIIREKLFARLADEGNHGDVMVSRSLGFLAAAKNGLSEDEMIDALSLGKRDGPVLTDFRRRAPRSPDVDRLPVIVWSRLYLDLEPYLTERAADRTSLLGFYHRQLAQAVKERYLSGDDGLARHRELAGYFGDQDLQPNLRKMSELPYQQTMAASFAAEVKSPDEDELWDGVVKTLTDFEFLERKATDMDFVESTDAQGNVTRKYTGIYQIRDDYALALQHIPGGGGAGVGGGGRRRIIVTGVDFGNGLVLRCPHCNTLHPFDAAWKGQEMDCPNDTCRGPLKVNPFVVERRR